MVRPAHLASIALLLAACAEGSSIETGAGSGGSSGAGMGGGGGRGGASGSGDDSSASVSSSSPTGGTTSSQTPDQSAGPTSSSGGDGGAGDGGAGGSGDATTSSTGATTSSTGSGQTCNFTSPNDCAGAEDLGAIAGDEDGTPITVQGVTSKWFTIWIEERASGISETDLSYRVSLVSPAGMNYDLIVHEGPQDGGVDCNAAPQQGVANGNGEEVANSWDDDQGIGGEDDSAHLSIEVRYLSGEACQPSDSYTLTIEGYI